MLKFWEILDQFGIIVGLGTGLVTILIWIHLLRKERKDNDLISISLTVPVSGFKATLPGKIRRKNLTRAELQGLLGMLPMHEAGKRYQLPALNSAAFFEELEVAQVNREINEVEIVCEAADMRQFDADRLSAVCEITQENE